MTGIEKDNMKSIAKTNKAMGIGNWNPWKLTPPQ